MAVTDYQSLYGICNKIALSGISDIGNIGGYETYIDLYSQEDIDKNYNDIIEGNYDEYNNLITKCSFGSNTDESHIILIASDNIEIPENYTLTPINPKKSLVIMCNKFINNGTLSMVAKGPNILPHEYYLIGQSDGYEEDIIVPAYANNRVNLYSQGYHNGINGNDGVNRQCGSGGTSSCVHSHRWVNSTSGSGYAFGGGAGGAPTTWDELNEVDPIYPMRANPTVDPGGYYDVNRQGAVGNPTGTSWAYYASTSISREPPFGVGGRIIIFCSKFINNGIISVNGTDQWEVFSSSVEAYRGGASGAGAIDVFYNDLITEGTITANGGTGYLGGGSGGNGSITLTQYNASSFVLPGYANKETISEVIRLTKLALKEKVAKDELASLILEDTYTSLTKTYSSQKIEEAILALIDDTQVASMLTNKTLSSQMIQSLIPKLVSQLENDKGYIAREISAVEVSNIWDNVFGV